jgi:hypothetical protein
VERIIEDRRENSDKLHLPQGAGNAPSPLLPSKLDPKTVKAGMSANMTGNAAARLPLPL